MQALIFDRIYLYREKIGVGTLQYFVQQYAFQYYLFCCFISYNIDKLYYDIIL